MSSAVIQSKLAVPPLGERLAARPRVSGLVAELLERHPLVLVTATAGAGKTTAVVQAAALLDRPTAWLTLDDTDAAPGRLLTYLEAALARRAPAASDVATNALAARIPHAEAAGLLAEAAAGVPMLLVVDGLEQFAGHDAALAVIGAPLRYAPPTLGIALLSRSDVGVDLGDRGAVGSVATVGEAALAFTPEEAAEALERAGREGVDPARAVADTGGWVTGVLFEAWTVGRHVQGVGGEADPLHGYLATADPVAPDPGRARAAGGDLHARRGHRRAGGGARHRRRRGAPCRPARPPSPGGLGAGPPLHAPAPAPSAPTCGAPRAAAGDRGRGRCAGHTASCWSPKGTTRRPPTSCCGRARATRLSRRPSRPSAASSSGWTSPWPKDGCGAEPIAGTSDRLTSAEAPSSLRGLILCASSSPAPVPSCVRCAR